jgi:hypothetical protein
LSQDDRIASLLLNQRIALGQIRFDRSESLLELELDALRSRATMAALLGGDFGE